MTKRCILIAVSIGLLSALMTVAADPRVDSRSSIADAEAFIRTWVEAQNSGNYRLYASLYLNSFSGVKRTGTNAYHYQYKEWLADRKKMFAHPFTVTVENLVITPENGVYQVTFIQTWESGTYKDRGAKVILLAAAGAELRIVREEMLNSTVMAPHSDVTDLTHGGNLFFVVDGSYIVFAGGFSPSLGKGPPSGTAGREQSFMENGVVKHIDERHIPSVYLKYRTETFRVYDHEGTAVLGRIDGFQLFTTFIPHFGEVEYFREEGVSRPEILKTRWEEGTEYQGNVFLVGHISGLHGDGVWARRDALPDPVFFERVDDGAGLALAAAESKKRGPYREYLGERAALPEEEREYYGVEFDVRGYRHPRTGASFYISTLSEGDPCGEWLWEMSFLWKTRAGGIELLDDYECPAHQPFAVVDLDNDGYPELFFEGWYGVLLQVESRTLKTSLSVPFLDCGC
ncbi:MAG TPA: hypothetical protein ENN69_02495 [Spirochaetia bacterium]|nr:hypothetical protein [Spirochaetia bacterium]